MTMNHNASDKYVASLVVVEVLSQFFLYYYNNNDTQLYYEVK